MIMYWLYNSHSQYNNNCHDFIIIYKVTSLTVMYEVEKNIDPFRVENKEDSRISFSLGKIHTTNFLMTECLVLFIPSQISVERSYYWQYVKNICNIRMKLNFQEIHHGKILESNFLITNLNLLLTISVTLRTSPNNFVL